MEVIADMMEKGVEDKVFPGAVLLVSVNSKVLFHKAFGRSDLYLNEMMTKETIFDLASLTKPLATTMAVLKLVQDGLLSLDQKIGSVLDSALNSSAFNFPQPLDNTYNLMSEFTAQKSEFAGQKKNITIEQLLRHTSGLPAYRPYYEKIVQYPPAFRRNCLRALVIKEPLENSPGDKQIYSDLGYILLAWIVEILSKQRMDKFLRDHVYSFLGIDDLFFISLLDFASTDGKFRALDYGPALLEAEFKTETNGKKFAATENCPWRKKIVKAEVHDDNAWAAGGIEGHAGLFGTASAVFVLLSELMNGLKGEKTKVISGKLLKQFAVKNGSGDMTAGFDTPSGQVSASGRHFSSSSLGHLGFTGTSFWMDPEKSIIVILLTNRVHPSRNNDKIRWFRPLIHDLIMEKLMM